MKAEGEDEEEGQRGEGGVDQDGGGVAGDVAGAAVAQAGGDEEVAEEAGEGEPEGEDGGRALGHDGDEGHGIGCEAGGDGGGEPEELGVIWAFHVFEDDVRRVRLAIALSVGRWGGSCRVRL